MKKKVLTGEVIPASKAGRPSAYKKQYVDELIDMAMNGKGVNLFCVKHRITETTFYNWRKKYPEFDEAAQIAKMTVEEYYLNMLEKGALKEIDCNPILLQKLVEVHSDRAKKSHTGGSINVNIANVHSGESLTDIERQSRIQDLKQKLLDEMPNVNISGT